MKKIVKNKKEGEKDNINFDVEIGMDQPREWSKKEFDELEEFRRQRYNKMSAEAKLDNVLLSFKFTLEEYLDQEDTEEIVRLGDFIKTLLMKIEIRQSQLARYIDLTPQNFNKYIVGERKINIDMAMKFERIFKVEADILMSIQLKNEILSLKAAHNKKKGYDKYDIKDLLSA